MAVDTYSITGSALIYVGTGGSVGSATVFSLLGYTEAGVDMDITEEKEGIATDLFGSKVPQDYQDMGMYARLVIPLIAYDSAVLATLQGRGDRTYWGSTNTPGIPLIGAGYSFPVIITCPLAAAIPSNAQLPQTPSCPAPPPWCFYYCLLMTGGQRLASKANPFRIELRANPWKSYTATTGKNAPLWAREVS